MNILITGASGFIAQQLCERLASENFQVVGTVRKHSKENTLLSNVQYTIIPEINSKTDWTDTLKNIDIVIHLAARVHVLHETATNPLAEYEETNTRGTINLAKQAEASGVKRFIFLSTIGVNGGESSGRAFTEADIPSPHNDYSISKTKAENLLNEFSKNSQMKVVILRAPLVYGQSNRGNFQALVNIISKGIPLPLANIKNAKSLIYVGNLVDAIVQCFKSENAHGTYIVSDKEDVSTPELIKRIARALNRPARLIPMPISLLKLAARLAGKSLELERLTNTLVVDSSKITNELNWKPPYTMEEGLKKTFA